MSITKKKCPKCNTVKDVTEFYKNKRAKDGYRSWCKDCSKADNAKREPEYKLTRKEYRKTDTFKSIKKAYYLNNKDKILEENRAWKQTLKGRFHTYLKGATSRGLDFKLNLEEFETFWQLPCYYCDSPIDTVGLDRINSQLGYEINNVRPCCTTCNKMKLDLTQDDFYNKLLEIVKHRGLLKCQ